MNEQTDEKGQNVLRPRMIVVKILQSNGCLLRTMNVKVVPRPNPIDHTFRFYEPESTHVCLALPSFSNIPLNSFPSISVASSSASILPRLVENN